MIKDIYVSSAWFDKQKSDIILQHNIGSQISIELDALNNRREFTWYVDSDGTQYYDDPSIPDNPINEDPSEQNPTESITYTATVNNANNGRVTVDKTSVVKGGFVKITIIPNSGYKLLRLTVNNVDVTGLVSNNLYIYNNVQEHIIISASFLEIYTEPDPQDPTDPDPTDPGEDPTEPITNEDFPVAQAIDLDLPSGIKWASWNMGSKSPLDVSDASTAHVGDHYRFCWGDPTGEAGQSLGELLYRQENNDMTEANIAGTKYDIATVKWGEGWQIPTVELFLELIDNCNMTNPADYTDDKGKTYRTYKLTSKVHSDRFIYLPEAGLISENGRVMQVGNACYYWTAKSKGAGVAVPVLPMIGEANVDATGYPYTLQLAIRPIYIGNSSSGNEPDVPQQLTQYTITTTASEGGKITASSDTIDDGGSVTFTFTNYAGYVLGSVTVNGVEKDLNTDLQYGSKFEYTITDIHENINVTAIFVESESVRMRVMSSDDITYYYSYWAGDTKQSSYGQLPSETRYNYVQKNRPLTVCPQSAEDGKVIQSITVNGQIFYPQTPYDVSISYDCITTTDIDIVVHLLDIPANPHDESGNEWVPLRDLPQNITKIFVCTELTQDTSMGNTYILGTAVGSGAGFFLNDQDGLYLYNDGSYQYYYISNAPETKTLIFDDGRTFTGKVINLKYPTNITKQQFSLVKYYGM